MELMANKLENTIKNNKTFKEYHFPKTQESNAKDYKF